MGHFDVKKTEDVLATHFFWPKMRRDVERFVAQCTTCLKAKSRLNAHGLYAFACTQCSLGGYIYGLCFRFTSNKEGEGQLLMLLICSFVKLFACMVCQILLFQIVILNFLATFGDVYGLSWGRNCFLVLLVTPKLMDKLKQSIERCLLCLGVF